MRNGGGDVNLLLENGDRLLLENGDSVTIEGIGVAQQFVDLADVDASGMADGDVFVWDLTAGKFKPASTLDVEAITVIVRAAVGEALIAGAAAI